MNSKNYAETNKLVELLNLCVRYVGWLGVYSGVFATRFLKRFVEHDTLWLHVDLSSSRCEDGLGIVAHEVNGFGVAWGLRMLQG